MAFDSTRDLRETVPVPLEYSYILARDEAGALVLDDDTKQPMPHKFSFVMLRKRASELDTEEAARVKRLAAGNGHQPLSEVELLVRLTVSHAGFDDFPTVIENERSDFEAKMRTYFGRKEMEHFVNDALLRHQHILLPLPFRLSV